MNLLLGLYKPTKGKILVDGIDINENLGNWQSKIGYVPQNIYFIDDSIKKNIAFGYENNSINEKRVLESLKLSKLYNFVSSLEKNIETNIGELGDQISGSTYLPTCLPTYLPTYLPTHLPTYLPIRV